MSIRPATWYYGWVVAAAAGSMQFANAATAISILTIFVAPMSEEFGWGRTEVAGATTAGAILGAALAPFIGRLVDRFGARIVLTAGGAVIGLACVYLSVMQTLLGFYLAFTAARIADQGGVKIGASVTVGKWFQRYRGRVTGLVFFIETAGVIALAPLTHLVIGQWGWRGAWLGLGTLMFVLGVVPCALWVRRPPEDLGLAIDGREPAADDSSGGLASPAAVDESQSLTLRDAARTPGFWIALAALFLGSSAIAGPGLHLVPYLTEQGLNATAAVSAISVMATAGAVGAILSGVAADRVSPRWLMVALYLTGGVALLLLVQADTLVETYAVVILMGLIGTGVNTLTPLMWAANYGRGSLGAIHGVGRASQVMGFAVGPLASGIAYDSAGTYQGAFLALAVVTLVAAGLMAAAQTWRARPWTGSG